ncbi:MAG: hypothetical protein LQ339_006689 [Xanthoria mediterranea]|nr:MAG: hypothetical protein LQ339_006689 [Xanthoria mediterranea]
MTLKSANNTLLNLSTNNNHHKSPPKDGHPLISCSGTKYRSGLNGRSCNDAALQIPDDPRWRKFGQYTESGLHGNVHLPLRFISFDGLCTIDIVVQDQSVKGVASYAELGIAASNLVSRCAVARGVGGIAMNVGDPDVLICKNGRTIRHHGPNPHVLRPIGLMPDQRTTAVSGGLHPPHANDDEFRYATDFWFTG